MKAANSSTSVGRPILQLAMMAVVAFGQFIVEKRGTCPRAVGERDADVPLCASTMRPVDSR
jgi:hypothetical protein